MKKSTPILLALILSLFALSIRLFVLAGSEVHVPIRADAAEYVNYAVNLKKHGVYSFQRQPQGSDSQWQPKPDAKRPPGYPILLTAFLNDDATVLNLTNLLRFQAVLGALIVLFTFLLFRPLIGNWLAALAATLVLLDPYQINAGVYVLTETLFSLLILTMVWLLSRSETKWRWMVFAGLSLGAATLVRPTGQPLLLLMVPAIWLAHSAWFRPQPNPSHGKVGVALFAFVLGFSLLVAPWMMRNQIQTGQFSDPQLTRNTLQHGMYPNLRYQDRINTSGFPYRFDPMTKELKTTNDVLHEIQRRFTEEPIRHLQWFLIDKPITLWSWGIRNGAGSVFTYPMIRSPFLPGESLDFLTKASFYAQLPLAVLGLLTSLLVWIPRWARRISQWVGAQGIWLMRVTSAVLLGMTVIHMLGFPLPRYVVPVRPLLFSMALVPFALAWRTGKEKTSKANPSGY